MTPDEKNTVVRINLLDWLKGCAIIAVVLDHMSIAPKFSVVWSVNLFVFVTAYIFSKPGYVFTVKKLALKVFQVLYLTVFAVLLIRAVMLVFNVPRDKSLLSVFLNPFAFFSITNISEISGMWPCIFNFFFFFIFFLKIRRNSSLFLSSRPPSSLIFYLFY